MAERMIRHHQRHRRRNTWLLELWPIIAISLWLLVGAALGGLVVLNAVDALLAGRCW